MGFWWRLFGLVGLLCFASCRPQPLEEALKGQLPSVESNTVITEYCQSCHIHRAFNPEGHAARVGALYDRPPYTSTAQCRACHLVDEDTWGKKSRKTIWPAEVAANRFQAWEKRLLSEKPVTAMPAGITVRKRPDTK